MPILCSYGVKPAWSSRSVTGHSGSITTLFLQTDGNLVGYDANGKALFATGTAGHHDTFFQVQDDGNMVLYTSLPVLKALWSSNTGFGMSSANHSGHTGRLGTILSTSEELPVTRLTPGEYLSVGQSLISSNGLYELILQGDGNAVLYATSSMWSSRESFGHSGAVAKIFMQPDGNFVGYDSNMLWQFQTRTSENAGAFVQLQDDGNAVVYNAAASKALWASGTVCPQGCVHGKCVNSQCVCSDGWTGAS
jgi:hypothetical protein